MPPPQPLTPTPTPPSPSPTPTPAVINIPVPLGDPYLVIVEGKIYNTTATQEFSLDNGQNYSDCNDGIVSVDLSVGNRVWVREKADPNKKWFLGEVKNLSGYADLFPSQRFALTFYNGSYWEEADSFLAGQEIRLYYKYANIGTGVSNKNFTISFYLSTDPQITTADTPLYTGTLSTLSSGLQPPQDSSYYVSPESSSGRSDYKIPSSFTPGVYYLGYIIDAGNSIPELNEDNNTTTPSMVRQIYIKDPDSNSSGAFKIVNSWGKGVWENKDDGHYWLTYQTAKAINLPIYYFYNDTSVPYKPTVIAVFKITHPERDKCLIKIGLGDPATSLWVKEFQARIGSSILSGAIPFPANNLALDISEFAHAINDADLFISITTASGAVSGSLDAFEVRFFNSSTLFKTINGSTGSFAGSGVTTSFIAQTAGKLTTEELIAILPPIRATLDQVAFIEEKPSAQELAEDMALIGVYEPNKNYNKIIKGRYGTGFVPPSLEEWHNLVKLRGLQTSLLRATGQNQEIDHSATQYFPPIGNQGSEGSCTCFALGYYAHTFMTAKEFNWNLSGTVYGGTWPGAPQSNLDKIMSPDFIYHQINEGNNNGSSPLVAIGLLERMGCATWNTMPYDHSDSTTWPSEAAFLEAAKYRSGRVYKLNNYLHYGYFIIRNDSDINLLKQLLLNGYVVATAIDANTIYDSLTNQDVVDLSEMPSGYSIDHAQTIVGFKDGTRWNPNNPD